MPATLTLGTPVQLATAYGTLAQMGTVKFGPYTFGANRYVIINDEGASSGNNTFFVNKSTDGGATWTQFGDGGNTGPWFVGLIFSVLKSGNLLYIFTNDLDRIPGHYWLHKFDTTSDTMTEADTGIAVHASVEAGNGAFLNIYFGGTTRANGNLILAFCGGVETISGSDYTRVYWAEYNGSTWTAPALIPGQAGLSRSFGCYHIDITSGGRLYFFLISGDTAQSGGNPTNLWMHIITNDGSFGTLQTVSTDLNIHLSNYQLGSAGMPLIYTDGSSVIHIIAPFNGGSATTGPPASGTYTPGPALLNYIVRGIDAVNPTFTVIQFDSTTQMWGFQYGRESAAILTYLSGVLFILWTAVTGFATSHGETNYIASGTIYYSSSTDNGLTWTAAVALIVYTAPLVSSGLSRTLDSQSELIVYRSDSTKWYGVGATFKDALHHFFFTITAVIPPPPSTGRGYVFELEKGVGRVATWQET